MYWLRNWEIKTKILSLVILMALFISSVGFVGYYYNARANFQMTNIYSDNLMTIKYVNDARAQNRAGEAAMFLFLLTTDKATQQTQQTEMSVRTVNFDKDFSAFLKLPAEPYEIERQQKIQTERTTYGIGRQKAIDLANQGDRKGAYDYFSKNVLPSLNLINTDLQELADFNAKQADITNSQNVDDNAMSVKLLIALSIAVTLLCLVLGSAMASLIANSIKKVLASVERVAAGDLLIEDITIKGNDETGKLATSFNMMKNNLYELVTELRKIKVRLQEAQEFAHLGYWELDTIRGELSWSDEMFRLLGYKPQQFIPTFSDFTNAIHPDDKESVVNILVKPIIECECELDFRINRQKNETIWIHQKIQYEYNSSGKQVRKYGIDQDITQRKLSELKLKESEEKFKELASNLGEVIWVRQDEQLIYINPAYEKVWGKTCQSLYDNPHSFIDSIHPDDKERIVQVYLSENYTSKGLFDEQFKIINPDGTIRWIWARTFPICDENGKIIRRVGIGDDITKIKDYEESLRQAMELAETANKAKSMFLTNMRHELMTPLNGILGIAQLLGMSLQDEQKEMAGMINTCGNNLLNIIKDILDLSKIEAGKAILVQEEFDINSLVVEVYNVIQPLADQKGLEYDSNIDKEISGHLMGDKGRLRQVLLILLGNAIKFTQYGSIELSVRKGLVFEDKSQLVFSIKDTGIGIAEDKIGQLFITFMQIDDSYTKNYGGTGLGLAISKKLVSMMDGKICVESKLGVGSEFKFSAIFKLKTDSKELIAVDTEEHRQLVTKYSCHKNQRVLKPKILLAEDNEINREVVLKMLKSHDINCDVVVDGKEACRAVLRKDYDLVFMDCLMPEMDGYEATRNIRKTETGRKHTKIIAMTANAMEGDREKCLIAGMDEYMSKPIDFEIMLKIIEETTGLRRDELTDERFEEDTEMIFNIDGIDVKKAVNRLGGDQKFFRKLLTNFRKNQNNVITEIRQALKDGDARTAERLAHTVKGIAGDIAAQEIYRLASELESEIHAESFHNVEALLRQLEQVLARVFASIASLERSVEKCQPSYLKPVNLAILNPLLVKLAKLLNENDMEAVECLEEITKQTEQTSFAHKVMEMKEYSDQYYFQEALKVLDDINKNAKSQFLDEEGNYDK